MRLRHIGQRKTAPVFWYRTSRQSTSGPVAYLEGDRAYFVGTDNCTEVQIPWTFSVEPRVTEISDTALVDQLTDPQTWN